MRWAGAVLVLLLVAGPSICRGRPGEETAAADSDSLPAAGRHLAGLPVVFSTPETGFGAGAGVLLTVRGTDPSPDSRPSAYSLLAVYTEKNQTSAELGGDVWFATRPWQIRSGAGYQKFPTTFYGIGNRTSDASEEQYTLEMGWARGSLVRRLPHGLRAGWAVEARKAAYLDRQAGGLIATGAVPGSRGGLYAGTALFLELDTKENGFAPLWGSYALARFDLYDPAFGGDVAYRIATLDLRKYVPLGKRHVLAAQCLAREARGGVPLQAMAQLGASLRGIFAGRYMDRSMFVSQVEYRFPIFRRWSGTAFVGTGDVADGLDRLRARDFKVAGGIGIRFALVPAERVNLRIDVGSGPLGSEPYFQALEAF